MDCSSYKLYHVHDEFDSRAVLENYYSGNPDTPFKDDFMTFPMEKLHNVFSMGHVSGQLLIDISGGAQIHHLYTACEFFQEIIVMRPTEQCIMEIMRWHDDRTGAFCWGHTTAHVTDLEGRSDECEAKEMKLKSAITHVVKFDPEAESLTDLIGVPQADCIIIYGLMDMICKTQDDYTRTLEKILKLLKPGGHLMLFGAINASYYTVGGHRFSLFTYDENFVRKALVAEGMTVLQWEVNQRKAESPLIDYDSMLFVSACKSK
ncbi:indolethylamine N-methyltransferase-like [Hyperolius riggenbachi]|uniref:indolethylamine N-methyltransferase-like n=1 Tax=Hyperolius riggenbachi TaxID=752182 RepID=UPI0035A39BC4